MPGKRLPDEVGDRTRSLADDQIGPLLSQLHRQSEAHETEPRQRTLKHEGSVVRDFYASLAAPVVVGIEATDPWGGFSD